MPSILRTLAVTSALLVSNAALAQSNTAIGAGSGVIAGALVGGPIGAVVGGVAGGLIGSSSEPRRRYYRPYRARYFVDRYGRRRYYRS